MATELGVAGPGLQTVLRSTALMTMKSVALDGAPAATTTSRAKRCGMVRKVAGMVTSTSRLETTFTAPPGCVVMSTPSRRTCVLAETKPEPKILTPGSAADEVSVACGKKALGIPPMAPG